MLGKLDISAFAFILTAIVMITLAITYTSTMIELDTRGNMKILKTILPVSFILGIMMFILSVFYFQVDHTYQYHFITAITMLIILPATLISAGVATITASNV